MRVPVSLIALLAAMSCRPAYEPPTPVRFTTGERELLGCYRVLSWGGPKFVIPTDILELDSLYHSPTQPQLHQWRVLPEQPNWPHADWQRPDDSVSIWVHNPAADHSGMVGGFSGRLAVRGDTLVGLITPTSDVIVYEVDAATGRRLVGRPNFRAVRMECPTLRRGT